MARKRAQAAGKASSKRSEQVAAAPTPPPPRYSTRSAQAKVLEPFLEAISYFSDLEDTPPRSKKSKAKTPVQPKPNKTSLSPPLSHHDDESEQNQMSDASESACSDDDDVEEIPREPGYPRFKDDLPNSFNGNVDPSRDYFSKAPNEVIDTILFYLMLDHDPDQGVERGEGSYKWRPHVLLSMAAMSRLFYHATEGFARRFLTKNKAALAPHFVDESHPLYEGIMKRRDEKEKNRRRSVRLANQPKPEHHEFHRKKLVSELKSRCAICLESGWNPGKLANAVTVCRDCEGNEFGELLTLTEAMKQFDLRDYMLLKSRKPGPRAKFSDLPAILHGSEYKPSGFPVFKTITIFYFRRSDVEMLARLVHEDVEKHLEQKREERAARAIKARTKRVRKFKIAYHQARLEITTGKLLKRHGKRLKKLKALDLDVEEEGAYGQFGCSDRFCYHSIGLCEDCGDVPGSNREHCGWCESVWMDRRFAQHYNR